MVQEPHKEQGLIGIYHYITTAYNIMFFRPSIHTSVNKYAFTFKNLGKLSLLIDSGQYFSPLIKKTVNIVLLKLKKTSENIKCKMQVNERSI